MTRPDESAHVASAGDPLRPRPLAPRSHAPTRGATWRDAAQALQAAAQALAMAAQIIGDVQESTDIQLDASGNRAVMGDAVPTTTPAPLLSARDLAARLGVDQRTIRRWRDAKKLPPAIDVAGVLRWRPDAVETWLREQEAKSR